MLILSYFSGLILKTLSRSGLYCLLGLGLNFSCLANQSGDQMSKKAWVQHIEQTLPQLLCKQDQYFQTCFSVSPKECVAFTTVLVKACTKNIVVALPEEIDQATGEHWGQMIGRCSYDLYEKYMQEKKLANKHCLDPAADHQSNLPMQPSP